MNERASMQPYIARNSGIDALEREIQQLKTALEVSESENKKLADAFILSQSLETTAGDDEYLYDLCENLLLRREELESK